ncbi:hypothetical protein [Pseudaminobacter sp. NGMCC 1.201702]|uniref:hypothetical protein n=1 Tax=Pseudaminobacter sp. NGMCC 1.201702 TaxID=3391825 RepID=UPI0039EFF44E
MPKLSANLRPFLAAGLLLLSSGLSSLAAERWEEAGSGAVAILPAPAKAEGVVGGSLVCAEQRWNLRLRREETGPAGFLERQGKISVDGQTFAVGVKTEPSHMTASVTAEMLEALKRGGRLSVSVEGGGPSVDAVFSLKGSRATIEAVAPKCSQIDMSAYRQIAFSDADPAVPQARAAITREIGLFRAATGKQPAITAAILDVAPQKRLLFASLCGSTSYYGKSGCNITVHAKEDSGAWREVFNSEGMNLYLDPNTSHDGWPNLMALPLSGGTEATRWVWNGHAYEVRDELLAEEDRLVEGLRGTTQ